MSERAVSPPSVSFSTFGCKVNQVDSERIALALAEQGIGLAAGSDAAVVIVNSCTVTAEADAKVRKAVRRALRAPGAPIVVVTGCGAVTAAEDLVRLGERVVVEPDASAVACAVRRALGDVPPTGPSLTGAGAGPAFRTRAMVKVEEGCDARCAYCIVPDARGAPRSEPAEAVLREVAALAAAGVAEVVLTGTNIGRYDAPGGLPELLRRVAETGVRRIRLSSIEPLDLDERLLAVAAGLPAFLPHLHVPLQSGSDPVLRAMGRDYDAETFLGILERAREALPGLALTTDVLAGFPGETAEDHAATARLCRTARFQRMHVFRYSPRPGTPASTMPDRVPEPEIARRARHLRELSGELFEAYRLSRIGGGAEVLVERHAAGRAEGTAEDHLKVRFSLEGASEGALVAVRLTGLAEDGRMTAVRCEDDASKW